uniref:Uncharacterized protein n=1 Tax=Rhizophora mucronata TaxID=61149 RepID=A0A2P2MXW4_RHIMU
MPICPLFSILLHKTVQMVLVFCGFVILKAYFSVLQFKCF